MRCSEADTSPFVPVELPLGGYIAALSPVGGPGLGVNYMLALVAGFSWG
jgi:hypothetical protein